jgi:hypothetical protein
MLFDNHLGSELDNYSLARWIADLHRDPRKLWQEDKTNVKDFRACLDLFECVLDGYIVGYLAGVCGYSHTPAFLSALQRGDRQTVADHVDRMGDLLGNHVYVSGMRKQPSEARDEEHESFILYLQQALMLRSINTV